MSQYNNHFLFAIKNNSSYINLNKSSDLEIQGFPGEFDKSYELFSSRKVYQKEEEENINIFDSRITTDDDHFIFVYTHQTSAGQSGGPLLLHLENKKTLLIGIHVSGYEVYQFQFFLDIK